MILRSTLFILAILSLVAGCAVGLRLGYQLFTTGFSAKTEPHAAEVYMARRIRHLAIPIERRNTPNPVPRTSDMMEESLAHFADHCATCHANDGSGNTEIGQNLYPKAPDMRQQRTQSLSDGEIYFIIHNGVRLTGMPAWGPPSGPDNDSWALVHFIRRLPNLTADELKDMEQFNPHSPMEMKEEKEEEDFLNGNTEKK